MQPDTHPFWAHDLPEVSLPQPAFPARCDVAIIGGGYTGLSAALTLVKAGRTVIILEAGQPSAGASSRNGGQLGSGNQKFRVADLIARYGQNKAVALISAGTEMLRYVETLISEHEIECDFRRSGRFRGAMCEDDYKSMARDMEDLHRFAGVEFMVVPRESQHLEVGTARYFGGSVLPNDAALNPGHFHHGLLKCVTSAGAKICTNTRAIAINSEPGRHTVTTSAGSVSAKEVLVATNGYSGRRPGTLYRHLAPIGSTIIATEVLPRETVRTLLPSDRMYGNTARVFHYYRSGDNGRRILFGGRSAFSLSGQVAYRHLVDEMAALFPVLADTSIDYAWSGAIAYTRDKLPHLGRLNGVWYAAGYCGTGVSRSCWFGHKAALKIVGDKAGATPFDDLDFGPFRSRPIAPLGVSAATAWYRIRDQFDSWSR